MFDKGLVVLSGGQDSATCLAWTKKKGFDKIYTVSFDYGQRHVIELGMAKKLSELARVEKHFVIPINSFSYLGGSSLIEKDIDVSAPHNIDPSLPSSFLPGRNYIFLGLAATLAYQLEVNHLVTGVCQTDFSGYPDCRDNSIKAIQVALSNCLGKDFVIHTPLMWKTKAETVLMMKELGGLDWYKSTHTCYNGARPPCGVCSACKLRAKGFVGAGVRDPLLEGVNE